MENYHTLVYVQHHKNQQTLIISGNWKIKLETNLTLANLFKQKQLQLEIVDRWSIRIPPPQLQKFEQPEWPWPINSLAPGGFDYSLKFVNFKLISMINILSIFCEIAIRLMPQHLTDHYSTLVQVMV